MIIAYMLIIVTAVGFTFVIVRKVSDWRGKEPSGIIELRHEPTGNEIQRLIDGGCNVLDYRYNKTTDIE